MRKVSNIGKMEGEIRARRRRVCREKESEMGGSFERYEEKARKRDSERVD